MDNSAEQAVELDQFESQCLGLIEEVASGKLRRVVLTRSGRPVAALVPYAGHMSRLHGALRHMMRPVPGVDLAAPTGETWAAERD